MRPPDRSERWAALYERALEVRELPEVRALCDAIADHRVEHPTEGVLLGNVITWRDRRPMMLVVDAPAPTPDPEPTTAASAARTRFDAAIAELVAARVELQAEDPQHAHAMDLALLRWVTGADEVRGA